MSLRWRLVIALAVLATLATATTALFAYRSTESRLRQETDRFLAQRAGVLTERGPGGGGLRDLGRGPGAMPRSGGNILSELVRSDLQLQVVGGDGTVLLSLGSVALPVDAADTRLASGTSDRLRFRTVTVEGDPYRVLTVPFDGGAVQLGRDETGNANVLAALRLRFALLGGVVVAAAVAVGWVVARQVTTPLHRLTRAAEQIAATGDLGVADDLLGPVADRGDEAGRLTRAWATMLEALAGSRASQQQLVQDAGHELRTPLTSLRTNLDVLARHPDLPSPQRDALLADVRSELAELGLLVDELVLLAADHRDDEAAEPLDLGVVAQRLAARAARRHRREVLVGGTGAVVVARHGGLERALGNLLDNAAKFSPADRPIEVELDGARVTVRDHGPGIDPADLGQVFDRFYRATAARALPGSGLGLAIVRREIEADGGRVWAANHPDGGAVVGFELPLAAADAS